MTPVADAPRPAECWGLYDASGKLVATSSFAHFPEWKHYREPGWTIRRVRVTVKEGEEQSDKPPLVQRSTWIEENDE